MVKYLKKKLIILTNKENKLLTHCISRSLYPYFTSVSKRRGYTGLFKVFIQTQGCQDKTVLSSSICNCIIY